MTKYSKKLTTNARAIESESVTDLLNENESFAVEFLKKALRFKLARVDRDHFLRSQLKQAGISSETIAIALRDGTTVARIPPEVLDEIASSSIHFET